MPEYLWRREEPWSRRILLAPLRVPEAIYRAGAFLHRLAYESGVRHRVDVPLRVVSVGNLTVGGSGKTPVAAWLARQIRARGWKVAVLSRGVRGSRMRLVNVVSDGSRVLLGPAEVGDEPVWVARQAREIPVLAGRNRVALALRARALFGAEVVVLDDGFQHHRLEREVDLVCLDAELGFGNGHVLPRGPLREPPRGLRRAHAVLWTRAAEAWKPPSELPGLPGRRPQFVIPIVPIAVRDLATGRAGPLSRLKDARVGVIAAVARPERLIQGMERLGGRVVDRRIFPDHHLYRERDLADLDPGLEWITTAKDAVKIPAVWAPGRRILVLEEEVRPVDPSRLMEWVLARIDVGGRL
jgi:tetraacyldisaccharide 4'-kinase